MSEYRDHTEKQKDTYYQDKSLQTMEAAYREAVASGKSPEEITRAIRRSYCYGQTSPTSPVYKKWRKILLKFLAEKGLPQKAGLHKQTQMMLEKREN